MVAILEVKHGVAEIELPWGQELFLEYPPPCIPSRSLEVLGKKSITSGAWKHGVELSGCRPEVQRAVYEGVEGRSILEAQCWRASFIEKSLLAGER